MFTNRLRRLAGVLGTAAGAGTGSYTLLARHAHDEADEKGRAGAGPSLQLLPPPSPLPLVTMPPGYHEPPSPLSTLASLLPTATRRAATCEGVDIPTVVAGVGVVAGGAAAYVYWMLAADYGSLNGIRAAAHGADKGAPVAMYALGQYHDLGGMCAYT